MVADPRSMVRALVPAGMDFSRVAAGAAALAPWPPATTPPVGEDPARGGVDEARGLHDEERQDLGFNGAGLRGRGQGGGETHSQEERREEETHAGTLAGVARQTKQKSRRLAGARHK